ncbi:hypothetical protein [Halioxenophilus sp. WMMB6]|uniref:hypothetical protein n=1 Tax=Halioxenophilus sp. WMMB6 TaxID=3073815 RepID=UPI00295E49F4|nr:hypothetical protein [Halioxenophilus sp. WMMB6]
MDLHDFSGGEMYFDESLPAEVSKLIDSASEAYAEGNAEYPLLRAYFLAPESLTVLVSLYRFYYYQHRYVDALHCADKAMAISSAKLEMDIPWQKLDMQTLAYGLMNSMTLVRFYLMTLKGAGYLNLRLDNVDLGVQMLEKVLELDKEDRLGTGYLLATVEGYQRRKNANFGKLTVVA